MVTGSNIAVRLEGIAEPGGISISDDARRQIRGKVDITFEDLGSQSLKNIAEPMRVWRVPNGRAVPAVPNRLPVDGALALPRYESPEKAERLNENGPRVDAGPAVRPTSGHHAASRWLY